MTTLATERSSSGPATTTSSVAPTGPSRPSPPMSSAPASTPTVRPAALAAIDMLSGLPQAALAELAERATIERHPAGHAVFHEGDDGDRLHLVRDGLLKVVRPSQDGNLILSTLTPGQAFGELAVLTGKPRLATVLAVQDSETIELRREDIDRVLDRHPIALRRVLGNLAVALTLAKEDVARHNQFLEQRIAERTEELRASQVEIVRRLAHAAESRDDETGRHIIRMSRLSARLGSAIGLAAEECETLLHASPLHDVGKIGIPDRILLKPGRLDPDEWEVMKTHTTIGARILTGSPSPVVRMGEAIAAAHHERWDGLGYPSGLRGEEIPLAARICSICDVYDALCSERPYKPGWGDATARQEIGRQAGRQFDPRLVEAFLMIVPERIEDDPHPAPPRLRVLAEAPDGLEAPELRADDTPVLDQAL